MVRGSRPRGGACRRSGSCPGSWPGRIFGPEDAERRVLLDHAVHVDDRADDLGPVDHVDAPFMVWSYWMMPDTYRTISRTHDAHLALPGDVDGVVAPVLVVVRAHGVGDAVLLEVDAEQLQDVGQDLVRLGGQVLDEVGVDPVEGAVGPSTRPCARQALHVDGRVHQVLEQAQGVLGPGARRGRHGDRPDPVFLTRRPKIWLRPPAAAPAPPRGQRGRVPPGAMEAGAPVMRAWAALPAATRGPRSGSWT